MHRIVSFLLLIAVAIGARADFDAPDFAYPQTVIGDADKVLATSVDSGMGLTRLQAVIEIVTAKSSLATDSLYQMPAFINRVASRESDPDAKGLMKLFEARTLLKIYNRSQWRYLRVDAPLNPLPENPDEWSGEQFKVRIMELTDSAIVILRPSMAKPIDDFKKVVEISEKMPTFYPYLRDFVYTQAINNVDSDAKEAYKESVLAMTTKGTPEWALWTALTQSEDRLLTTFKDNPDGVAGGYLLWKASYNNDKETEIVGLIRKYLADNSVNLMTDALKSRLKDMTQPYVSLRVPNMAIPSVEFDVECEYSYTDEVGVKIYRETNPTSGKYPPDKTLVGTFTQKVDKDVVKGKIKIPVKITKSGNYLVYGICNGVKRRNGGYTSLIVAPWVPFAISQGNENVVIVAGGSDGVQVKGVKVDLWSRFKKTKINVGTTGDEGYLTFHTPKAIGKNYTRNPLMLSDKTGSVFYDYHIGIGSYVPESRDNWIAGDIMVSRPVYHPGDTVGWSAVVVEKSFKPVSSDLVKNMSLRAVLRDANMTPIDTIDVTTDEYGRASGSFAIPSDLLPGRFNIWLTHGRQRIATASVMVSDFKAPVFELKDVEINYTDTAYVLTGQAVRYSGVGVPDAEVTAKFEKIDRFWYSFKGVNSGIIPDLKGNTDTDGFFRITVPMKRGQEGCYRCNVIVTNAAADIAAASTRFRAGKPYLITCDNNNDIFNVDKPVDLPILALDAKMKPAAIEAKWELIDSTNKVVASAMCTIDTLGIKADWSKIPAGTYGMNIVPTDTTLFDKNNIIYKVTLYSIEHDDVPDKMSLLVPQTEIVTSSNNVETLVGVGANTHVYAVTFGKDGKAIVATKELKKGFHKFNFELADTTVQRITFVTVNNCKVDKQEVTVHRKKPSKKLTLKGESWRDRVVPGTREEWKIRLTDAEGRGLSGAMVATMYNRSLNALSSLSWPANLETLLSAPQLSDGYNISYPFYEFGVIYKSGDVFRSVSPMINAPAFKFENSSGLMYSESMIATGYGVARQSKRAKAEAEVKDLLIVADDSYEAEEPKASNVSLKDTMLREEVTEEEDADSGLTEEFHFREAEALQALWMPDVTIDTTGVATLSFTVPDAIGSWAFRATAWTEDCRVAEMLASLVASKPVMVQPSLPRFLRQGDKARVLATAINNTDSVQIINTHIEIFNPSTGAILAEYNEVDELGANGQCIVGIDVEAPVDASVIGYRVKSSTSEFADGEQSLIPILEASTMAIDSESFYLNDAEPSITLSIPADAKGNDIVAVQYCQNPVWDVVKSLPGLYDFEPKTACAAAMSAYAAMTAKGLLKQFPEIRDVLRIWQSNPSDSALVSKLEKNEDLKLALLAQTPFVGSANANTAQMQRLAMTFNEKDIDRVLKVALSTLGKLQSADGGFAWGSWSKESSPWITSMVLTSFGRLNETGYLPEDSRIETIVKRALAYLDRKVEAKDYAYTRLYSMFPDHKPSTVKGQKVVNDVVQYIVANWKKSDTGAKAHEALILNALGNKAVAAEIMTSISQFAGYNGKRGVSFPSVKSVDSYCVLLYAFAKIDPQSKLIDGMRQWLVLQTQATDDLGAWDPTSLVSAILSTGARWTSLSTDATTNVTIDGQSLEIGKVEVASGAFSERIANSPKKRTIKFTRPEGGQVAYGSIVTVGKRPLSSVKARGNDQLSISKRLLVEREGKWVETDEFKLGERVKVQLKVKSARNFEYVTINDDRPAAFEPVDQMPGWIFSTLNAYRENSDTNTRLFINWLPKGTYYLTYDMTAAYSGLFASGTATVQSQYAPELTARSSAATVTVKQ